MNFYYPLLQNVVIHHLNKFEFPSSKEALLKIWCHKSIDFGRRRYDKVVDVFPLHHIHICVIHRCFVPSFGCIQFMQRKCLIYKQTVQAWRYFHTIAASQIKTATALSLFIVTDVYFCLNANVCIVTFCLFVWVYRHTLKGRRHRYRQKASNFNLFSSLTPIEQCGFFFSVLHLLWYGTSVYDGHLQGPVTGELKAVELPLPIFTIRLSRLVSNIQPSTCVANYLTDRLCNRRGHCGFLWV